MCCNGGGACQRQHKRIITTPRMRCQAMKVPLFFCMSLICISTGVQLVVDNFAEVILGQASFSLAMLTCTSLTLGFDDRLGLLCSSALSRWGGETKTMEGNIKARLAERGLSGQRASWTVEWWVQLWTHRCLSKGVLCHVSWCCLSL